MPRAAIGAGAANHVVPLGEIAHLLTEVVVGNPPRRTSPPLEAVESLLARPGSVSAQLQAVDWSSTPLGPVRDWPEAARSVAC